MLKVTNNASSTLANSITSAQTSIALSGNEAAFPAPAAGDWFPAVIVDAADNREIVKVTARAGVTLTVVRGQEGTVAKAFDAGARIDLRLTAAGISELTQGIADNAAAIAGKLDTGATAADSTKFGGQLPAYYTNIIARLGFTPVQQGTGVNQLPNVVKIGWGAGSTLLLTIDATDFGNVWPVSISGNAATASDSAKLGGATADVNDTVNTIAKRDGSGYLRAKYFNTTHAVSAPGAATAIIYEAANDGFLRKGTPAAIAAIMNASLDVGGIGTYAFLGDTVNEAIGPGVTRAGSSLRYTQANGQYLSSPTPAGTWQQMGSIITSTDASNRSTLWLRIA